MQYSFTYGLRKAALYSLTAIGTLVAFAGFSEIQIWDLFEEYVRPLVGSLTVGGAVTLAINYVRFKRDVSRDQ